MNRCNHQKSSAMLCVPLGCWNVPCDLWKARALQRYRIQSQVLRVHILLVPSTHRKEIMSSSVAHSDLLRLTWAIILNHSVIICVWDIIPQAPFGAIMKWKIDKLLSHVRDLSSAVLTCAYHCSIHNVFPWHDIYALQHISQTYLSGFMHLLNGVKTLHAHSIELILWKGNYSFGKFSHT